MLRLSLDLSQHGFVFLGQLRGDRAFAAHDEVDERWCLDAGCMEKLVPCDAAQNVDRAADSVTKNPAQALRKGCSVARFAYTDFLLNLQPKRGHLRVFRRRRARFFLALQDFDAPEGVKETSSPGNGVGQFLPQRLVTLGRPRSGHSVDWLLSPVPTPREKKLHFRP